MPSSSAANEHAPGKAAVSVEELELFYIFRGLSAGELERIGSIIKVESVSEGEVIIHDGDEGDIFYLLLDGEVEITKLLVLRMSRQEVDQTDKSLIRLKSEPHPEFGKPAFGEMALLSATSKRSATVVATQPSRLGVISHERFLELCESDHEVGYRVFRNIAGELSNRLSRTNQDVLNLTTALSFVLTAR